MAKSYLLSQKCAACEGGMAALKPSEIKKFLHSLSGWSSQNRKIAKKFYFKNYYETAAFVNAVVWIAHQENHHPDIAFGYKECRVVYSTHAVKGLTKNDFICAAKIDALFSKQGGRS